MIKKTISNHHIVLFAIFMCAFIIRAYGLSAQPPTDDEAAAASAASNYLKTGILGQVMWYHPPLRNIVIFVSGKIFGGYSAWGLRFGSVLFGSLTVLLLGYLSFSLFRKKLISYLAAFFLCIDPLHISFSRQAFQEAMTPFFIIAGVFAAYHGIRKDNVFYCYLSGVFFGLASSSKWHGLFPWAASAAAYLFAPYLIKEYEGEKSIFARFLNMLSAYAVLPIVIYVAVYIPWLNRGYSIREFIDFQQWLVTRQYFHQASEYAEKFVPKGAYLWFVWPTAWADFVFHQGKAYLNIAMGNFLVWILTLPSLYFCIRNWFRNKSFESGYILVLFLISYLPLVMTTRGIWVFNSLAVIPFAFILSAYAISGLVDDRKVSMRTLVIYIGIIALVSGLMYPLSTMKALEYSYIRPLTEAYSPHKGANK